MSRKLKRTIILWVTSFAAVLLSSLSFAATKQNINNNKITQAMVTDQLLAKAQKNNNWKVAFATAKHGQVVFMSVSPSTNPNNEIGMETHRFDQIILVVEGDGKAVLNGKTSLIKTGDMIFIPQGTAHNVINSNHEQPLKIVSFYSSNDIPIDAVYKQKANEPKE